jgi:DNA polymerase-4
MPVENITRAIAHFDLDAFFVSVERMINPALNNKPLIVGWESERGVVAACSYETRKYGVHSAMPMKKALQLCPQAIVIPPSRGQYGAYSQKVTDIIAYAAPVYEKASIDEFYLDLTGLDKFFGCYEFALDLKKKIMQETGLPISFALSINKLVSKIATDTVKPNGQIEIKPGTEQDFLAPMPVEKIPMVGKETTLQLNKMGIFTIAQLAGTSKDTLRTFLGKHGAILWERAHGIDHTPVFTDLEQKSISTENTFEEDIADIKDLEKELHHLTEINSYELRKIHKFTCCVAVKIRYSDFETITRQMTVVPVATEKELMKYVLTLFDKFYQKNRPVRLLGVRYTHLVDQGIQSDLFHQQKKEVKLNEAMDELRNRFGMDSIGSAATE